jgi:hypothetical protein
MQNCWFSCAEAQIARATKWQAKEVYDREWAWRADPKPLHSTIQTIVAQNPNAGSLIAFQSLRGDPRFDLTSHPQNIH